MFFINEKAGVAYEFTEAGRAYWSSEDNDFTDFSPREFSGGVSKRVSEDEAKAFARANA